MAEPTLLTNALPPSAPRPTVTNEPRRGERDRFGGGGTLLALCAIVCFAAALRTAVAAVSPLFVRIAQELDLSTADYGLISALPPLCFAAGGFAAKYLIDAIGLSRASLICLVIMLFGHVTRSLASGFSVFLVGCVVIFLGMGIGNVLLPPLVKRYFPLRAASVSTLYITVLAVSTFVPPLVAVPIADATSWRWSLATWGVLTALAVLPWIPLSARSGAERTSKSQRLSSPFFRQGPAAWALAVAFGVSTLNAYAFFAWLPTILIDALGYSPGAAGSALALYAALSLPLALIVPGIAMKMRRPALLAIVAGTAILVGNLGLALWPATAPTLWITVAGLGPLLYPLCITLIMRLSETAEDASNLGGFSQSLGYAVGALGPFIVGLFNDISQQWIASLLFLSLTGIISILAGLILHRATQESR